MTAEIMFRLCRAPVALTTGVWPTGPRWCRRDSPSGPRPRTEVDVATSASARARIAGNSSLSSVDRLRVGLPGPPQRPLRRQAQVRSSRPTLTAESDTVNSQPVKYVPSPPTSTTGRATRRQYIEWLGARAAWGSPPRSTSGGLKSSPCPGSSVRSLPRRTSRAGSHATVPAAKAGRARIFEPRRPPLIPRLCQGRCSVRIKKMATRRLRKSRLWLQPYSRSPSRLCLVGRVARLPARAQRAAAAAPGRRA